MRFSLVLHTDDGVRYGVTVPDLPGCFSAGDSFDEALESVKEAIGLHLEGMVDDGAEIPIPRPIAEHRNNLDYAEGIWAVVEMDTTRFEGKAEKINIRVPAQLLRKIDIYAKAHGETRSGFLARAARQVMRGSLEP